MDYYTLDCFAAIAEAGTLSEAATRLHISQSALSGILRRLEEEVGQKLFDRHGKSLSLNPGGRLLAETAGRISQRHRELQQAIRQSSCESGIIHIGVQTENDGILYLLANLRRQYPNISFRLHSMNASLADYLRSGMDFYVLPERMATDLPHVSVAGYLAVYAIVSADHPLAGRRTLRLEELQGERFAFAVGDEGRLEETYRYCLQAGLQPDVAFLYYDDVSIQLQLARQAGVVILAHNTFRQFRRSIRDVVEIPVDFDGAATDRIVLAWPPQPVNPLVTFLTEALQASLPEGVFPSKSGQRE